MEFTYRLPVRTGYDEVDIGGHHTYRNLETGLVLFEEFDREMDEAVKSYVDELEKIINTSHNENEDKFNKSEDELFEDLDKMMDKLRNNEKNADEVFNKIKKKYSK